MLKHYVEYFEPGFLFAETTERPVDAQNVELAKANAPKSAYAFRFYDIEEVVSDGEVLKGKPKNISNLYYMGGELYDVDRVRNELPNERILLSNMECNGYRVVKTPLGNFQPFFPGDVLLP